LSAQGNSSRGAVLCCAELQRQRVLLVSETMGGAQRRILGRLQSRVRE
jgi:hypothetical protein